MRPWGWAVIQIDWCLDTEGDKEKRSREKAAIYKPKKPQKITTLPTSWFRTCNLQNCEKIDFCCLSHPVCSVCYDSLSKLMYTVKWYFPSDQDTALQKFLAAHQRSVFPFTTMLETDDKYCISSHPMHIGWFSPTQYVHFGLRLRSGYALSPSAFPSLTGYQPTLGLWMTSHIPCPTTGNVQFGLCYTSEILDLSDKATSSTLIQMIFKPEISFSFFKFQNWELNTGWMMTHCHFCKSKTVKAVTCI